RGARTTSLRKKIEAQRPDVPGLSVGPDAPVCLQELGLPGLLDQVRGLGVPPSLFCVAEDAGDLGEGSRRTMKEGGAHLALVGAEPCGGIGLDRVDGAAVGGPRRGLKPLAPVEGTVPDEPLVRPRGRRPLDPRGVAPCAGGLQGPLHPTGHRLPVLLERGVVAVGAPYLPRGMDDRVPPAGRTGHHAALALRRQVYAVAVRGEVRDTAVREL